VSNADFFLAGHPFFQAQIFQGVQLGLVQNDRQIDRQTGTRHFKSLTQGDLMPGFNNQAPNKFQDRPSSDSADEWDHK